MKADAVVAALLTKYKGPEMKKAVLRPYTPVSDEGMDITVQLQENIV